MSINLLLLIKLLFPVSERRWDLFNIAQVDQFCQSIDLNQIAFIWKESELRDVAVRVEFVCEIWYLYARLHHWHCRHLQLQAQVQVLCKLIITDLVVVFLPEFDVNGWDWHDHDYKLLTTFIDLISNLLEDRAPDFARSVVGRYEQAAYVLVLTDEYSCIVFNIHVAGAVILCVE